MNRSKPISIEGISHPIVWLGVVSSTLLLLVLFKAVIWISLPAMMAIIIYYICAPAVDSLKRLGLTHHQAVGCLSILVIFGGTFAVLGTLPWLSAQMFHLQNHFSVYYKNGTDAILNKLASLENQIPWLSDSHLSAELRPQLEGLGAGAIIKNMRSMLGFFATWFPALLIVPYMTFFFLRDGPSFKKMLMRGVPNAFFEKVMLLLHRMDHQIHQYFRGMLVLTILDTLTLGGGLWIIAHGVLDPSHAFFLGLTCAIFAWLPYLGSILGLILVLLVCGTEAPQQSVLLVSVTGLFLAVRLVDDFIYGPMTVGKSLNIHPLLTVVMIFVGGSIAGIPGLFLVLPVLGICSVVGEVFEQVWFDDYRRARHSHAINLRKQRATEALK